MQMAGRNGRFGQKSHKQHNQEYFGRRQMSRGNCESVCVYVYVTTANVSVLAVVVHKQLQRRRLCQPGFRIQLELEA